MLRLTFKDLRARKLRLFTTSIAVLLGVAFMAGTLVLTDTIGKTFDDLFADVNAGTDAFVRSAETIETDFEAQRPRIDASVADLVAGVDGVEAVDGSTEGYAQIVDRDGEPIGDPASGAPAFGFDWTEVEDLNPFAISDGEPPASDDEIVIDRASATDAGYGVGDTVGVLTQRGTTEFTVSGVATFGQVDSPAGATVVLFTDAAAQEFVGEPGRYDAIAAVAAEGISEDELTARIAEEVPDDIEVLTGAAITEESQNDLAEGLSFFSTFLLTFAVIALFVGAFIIYNTFSIIVAQRSRETALLRALGASRRQVLGSVLVEAGLVGLAASALGLLAGIGVAAGLKALLAGFGIDIPASGLVIAPRTVIVSVLVGVGVTMTSAVFPARKAAKVPPVAAMRDVVPDRDGGSRRRLVVGIIITALGALSLLAGLYGGGDGGPALVGLGAAVVFVGVAVLGPVFAGRLSRVIGSPLPRLRGVAGTLARENAVRNPKRTSSTAAALMIGVGLIGFITVTAASVQASIEEAIGENFTGDLVVNSGMFGGASGLPTEVADRLAELPEVETAAGLRVAFATIDGDDVAFAGIDPSVEALLDFGVSEGSVADLDATGIAVSAEVARDKGLAVGDEVPVQFVGTDEVPLTIRAVYDDENNIVGDFVVGNDALDANVANQFDVLVYVGLADGVSLDEARPSVTAVTDDYPIAEVQDVEEFIDAQGAFVTQVLNLVYALLALAVIIALLGIANTLALSIFERTRELGLLRAVGMTRGQLRSAVRWESVIIALLGTGVGLVIGVLFGWAMVSALRDEGISAFRVPVGQLAVIVVIAALAGVAAAVLPARRAARLDVLDAIASP